eukprot:1691074-Rhodomonas_salina.1
MTDRALVGYQRARFPLPEDDAELTTYTMPGTAAPIRAYLAYAARGPDVGYGGIRGLRLPGDEDPARRVEPLCLW